MARERLQALLWLLLAVVAALLTARLLSGPFRLFGLSVSSPVNLESFAALCVCILIALRSRKAAEDGARGNGRYALPLLLVLGAAAWLWTLPFPFLADDYCHISNALRASPSYLIGLFTLPADDRFFRPLVLLGYVAQAHLWGDARVYWHAAAVALHIANGALVYALIRSRRIGPWPAAAGALLFLLSGSRVEVVPWISAEFDVLATFFFLLALLAFARWLRTGDRRAEVCSLAALLPALLSKESAYVFPLAAALLLWVEGVRGRRFLRLAVPPAILTAAVFLYRWQLLQGIGGYRMVGTGQPFFYSVNLFRTGKALLLRLPAILLFPLNWTHPPEWWLAVLMTASIAGWAMATTARANAREVRLAFGWILICAAPVHQFLLIDANLEKSRVLYLPSVGFALLLAAALASLTQRRAAVAAVAILGFQTAALEHNLATWRDVAQLADRTCATAAAELRQARGPLLVSDVPNVIDGVYFLHTGLRQCIESRAGAEAGKLLVQGESQANGMAPALIWDDALRGWRKAP